MSGHHHHSHDVSGAPNHNLAFGTGIALNCGFVVLEIAFGITAHSTALIADAVHNLSDVAGLVLAWVAIWLAQRAPNSRFTYGLRSTTILAALSNAVLLILACGGLAWEAIQHLFTPTPVAGATVLWVAMVGVAVNAVTALFFFRGRKDDLNIRGAFVHMAADAAVSLGVVIAGAVILRTSWYWLDPAMSLVILVVILAGTWGLLRDSTLLSLHGVPAHLSSGPVTAFLERQPGVSGVHHLHIWALSTTDVALTAHLVLPGGHPGDVWVDELAHALAHDYGIGHSTFQIESDSRSHDRALAHTDDYEQGLQKS